MGDAMGEVSVEALGESVCEHAARLHADTARFLGLVAEFDRREGFVHWGCFTTAQWLSWRCGIGLRAGREQVRVARALEQLPVVREEFASGRLSYSKVRALCRMATPATEAELVETALHATAAQLETVAGHYRRVKALADEREGFERRYVRWSTNDDGSLELRARLPAADGEIVAAALEALTAAATPPAPEPDAFGETAGEELELAAEAGTNRADAVLERRIAAAHEPIEQRRADALVALAQGAGVDTEVVVHVDGEVLSDADGVEGRCHTAGGRPVGTAAARRMCCDGALRLLTEDSDGKLDVGRRTRTISKALRRALRARDAGCVFPGCGTTLWVDAHHVHHWADGGSTALDNLVELCGRHHRLVHEGGYQLELVDGHVQVHDPSGRDLTHVSCSRPARGPSTRHPGIDPTTPVARWGGERPDYALWLDAILCTEALAHADSG